MLPLATLRFVPQLGLALEMLNTLLLLLLAQFHHLLGISAHSPSLLIQFLQDCVSSLELHRRADGLTHLSAISGSPRQLASLLVRQFARLLLLRLHLYFCYIDA